MWDLIVTVPGHCFSSYFSSPSVRHGNIVFYLHKSDQTFSCSGSSLPKHDRLHMSSNS